MEGIERLVKVFNNKKERFYLCTECIVLCSVKMASPTWLVFNLNGPINLQHCREQVVALLAEES